LDQVPVTIESRSAQGSSWGCSCSEEAAALNAYDACAAISGPQKAPFVGST